MHTCNQLKKEFLKKWIKGLQICFSSNKEISLLDRKKKIKLSANIALASVKISSTSWSKSLISEAIKDKQNAIIVDNLLDLESQFKLRNVGHQMVNCQRRFRSKKILKKSCNLGKRMKKKRSPPTKSATYIAKRLVKKRTQVLKRLVPGGESMDEFSLIKEALDYILSLRVQVDVMRSLANASEVLNQNVD